jgi:uncharacterized SAM-binding protein YcdF (DUF218 family)
MNPKTKRLIYLIGILIIGYFLINSIRIFKYSSVYFENKSDVIIVLGAGTADGQLSPIFKERINHSIYLYNKGISNKIIFTGGYGDGQLKSDSQIAKEYAMRNGISETDILIEEHSKYTIENMTESKQIMDTLNMKTALLVSDPFHMKRASKLAELIGINCKPSPTKTSMYQSIFPKVKQLIYETFYYSIRELIGIFK